MAAPSGRGEAVLARWPSGPEPSLPVSLPEAWRQDFRWVVQSRCPSDFARFTWSALPGGPGLSLEAAPELAARLAGDWPWVAEALVAGLGAGVAVTGPLAGLALRLDELVLHPTDSRPASFRRLGAEAWLATAQALAPEAPGQPPPLPGSFSGWRELAQAVQGAKLPQASWRHPQHLAVGAWLVQQVGLAEARRVLPAWIQGLNAAHGLPQSPTRGYHETLTQVWLGLVAAAWDQAEAGFGPVLRLHACVRACQDPTLPRLFHSQAQLASWAARTQWVAPDLEPYPEAWARLG